MDSASQDSIQNPGKSTVLLLGYKDISYSEPMRTILHLRLPDGRECKCTVTNTHGLGEALRVLPELSDEDIQRLEVIPEKVAVGQQTEEM